MVRSKGRTITNPDGKDIPLEEAALFVLETLYHMVRQGTASHIVLTKTKDSSRRLLCINIPGKNTVYASGEEFNQLLEESYAEVTYLVDSIVNNLGADSDEEMPF